MGRLKTAPSRLQPAPSRIASMPATDSWRVGRASSTARGYDRRWRNYREKYLAKHPLCVMCAREGRVGAASVVDHISPHRGDMRLFWEPTNHQPLCKPHHDGQKQRDEAASQL